MKKIVLKCVSSILILAILSVTNTSFARLESPMSVVEIERKTVDNLVAAGVIKPEIIKNVSKKEYDAAKSSQQIKTADGAGVVLFCIAMYCAYQMLQGGGKGGGGSGGYSSRGMLNKPEPSTSNPETNSSEK